MESVFGFNSMGANSRNLVTVNAAAVVVMLLSAAMYTRYGVRAQRKNVVTGHVTRHVAIRCALSRYLHRLKSRWATWTVCARRERAS